MRVATGEAELAVSARRIIAPPLVVWGLVAVGAEGGTVVPWVIEGVVSSVYLAYWVPPRYGVALSSKGDGVQLCINDGQCIVAAHFWNSVS